MQNKLCPKCNLELDVVNFCKNKTKRDGLSSCCKKCQNEYSKEHYNKNKKYYLDRNNKRKFELLDFIKAIKLDLKCSKCGYSKCIQALHFHHIDPNSKKFTISHSWKTGSEKRILEEISKCDILCANCHAEEHFMKVGTSFPT